MWGVCEPAYGGIEAKKRYFPNIAQEWQKSVPRMRVRKMGVLRTRISPKSGFANPISVVSPRSPKKRDNGTYTVDSVRKMSRQDSSTVALLQ